MLKIRLRRMGSRHRPFFRVVVSDSRNVPTAAALDEIGYYDPRKKPAVVKIDTERVDYWQGRGAQLSSAVRRLVRLAGQPVPVVAAEPESAPEKAVDKKATANKAAEKPAKAEEAKAEKAEAAAEPAAEEAPAAEAAAKEAPAEAAEPAAEEAK